MRAVAQRVREARVTVADEVVGAIGPGLLVYLGIAKQDSAALVPWMAEKLATLRIFEDEAGRFAHALREAGGAVLVVSQFTLYADVRKGRRPSFDQAAPPELAEPLYDSVCEALRALGLSVATGRFRANMQVHAVVDGPVTVIVDRDSAG